MRTNTDREEIIWCEILVSLNAEPALEFHSELWRVFRRYTEEERAMIRIDIGLLIVQRSGIMANRGWYRRIIRSFGPLLYNLYGGDRMAVFL